MKVIVIGCGRMGAGVAQALNLRGDAVTVVDKDRGAFEQLGPGFRGHQIVGVGFDRQVLLKAGIERADALVAVTANDAANVVTARLASRAFQVPRVVARLYDPRKAEVYRRLGLQTISPVSWAIHQVVDLLSYSPLASVLSLGSGEIDLVEVEAPPLLVGRSIGELTIPGEITVVAVTRGGSTFLPPRGTVLQQGDLVHLAVMASSAGRLRALLALA